MMKQKEFNALLGLLATSLGIPPKEIINWLHEMSQRYTPTRGTMAEYLSMVLAPVKPLLYILADNKSKTLSIGGSGTTPKNPHGYKTEWAPELTTIGQWFSLFKEYIGDELIIPRSIVSIEDGAFEFLNIKRIFFESRLVELPRSVCCGCSELTTVRLPDTLEVIKHSAFRYCERLAEINIPDSVQVIGELAFQGCNDLLGETKAKILEIGGPAAFGLEDFNHATVI